MVGNSSEAYVVVVGGGGGVCVCDSEVSILALLNSSYKIWARVCS